MKTNPAENDGNKDPALSHQLQQWQVKASLPPRFREQVWQRIERQEAQANPGVWSQFILWAENWVKRPALAFSYVAILMAAGIGTGYWRAEVTTRKFDSSLRAQYVQSLDPSRATHVNHQP